METIQFKTNIKCAGCIANVSPELNKTIGEGKWTINTQSPDKILTVSTDGPDESEIQSAVEKAGFKAERMK